MEPARIQLEPFRREDVRTLAGWLSDHRLHLATAPEWEYPIPAERIEREYFGESGGVRLFRASLAGAMIGHLGLRLINPTVGHLFHVIVDPVLHGKGYGKGMIDEVIRFGFIECGLYRLQLFVFEDNITAISRYMRAGFRIEGSHRDAYRYRDQALNTYSMALLRDEWEGP